MLDLLGCYLPHHLLKKIKCLLTSCQYGLHFFDLLSGNVKFTICQFFCLSVFGILVTRFWLKWGDILKGTWNIAKVCLDRDFERRRWTIIVLSRLKGAVTYFTCTTNMKAPVLFTLHCLSWCQLWGLKLCMISVPGVYIHITSKSNSTVPLMVSTEEIFVYSLCFPGTKPMMNLYN